MRLLRAMVMAAALGLATVNFAIGAATSTHPAPPAPDHKLGAFAGGGPIDLPDGTWYDAATGQVRGDTLNVDAGLLAERAGLDPAEAIARLRLQLQVAEIVPDLEAQYPDFAGARLEGGRVVAAFRGSPPAGAMNLLAPLGDALDIAL